MKANQNAIRKCVTCGSPLGKWKQLFCQIKCRPIVKRIYKSEARPKHLWKPRGRKPIREVRICPHCNESWDAKPWTAKKFCSQKCFADFTRKPKPVRHDFNCVTCGSIAKWPKVKFCSEKCSKKDERQRYKLIKRPKPVKPPLPPIECKVCKTLFVPKSGNHQMCSRKCHLKNERNKRRIKERGKKKPPHVRIKDRLSSRLRELLRRKGQQKKNAINNYTGCTPMEMMRHVESQFTKGMTWETYGVFGWHLDHIIPCERFDLTNEDHCRVCFNWRNIRPLWGEHNWTRQEMLTLDEALNIDPELVRMATEVGVRLW